MSYQLEAARATIDERLRKAEQRRLARAAQRTDRAARRATPASPGRNV